MSTSSLAGKISRQMTNEKDKYLLLCLSRNKSRLCSAPTRKMMHEGCEDGAHLVRLPFYILQRMWFVFKEGRKAFWWMSERLRQPGPATTSAFNFGAPLRNYNEALKVLDSQCPLNSHTLLTLKYH